MRDESSLRFSIYKAVSSMDDALRCLRDGAIGGRSVPFVLVQDTLDVLGGPALAVKVLHTFPRSQSPF